MSKGESNLINVPVDQLRNHNFRRHLRRGDIQRIADHFELTHSSISRIASGKQFNPDVIKYLVKMINARLKDDEISVHKSFLNGSSKGTSLAND